MKILESYNRIVKQLIVEQEVDDDKIIKYKDKEGESQEMTAGAAKKQPDDHPAKVAYNKMADDGGDDKKDSGGKLSGSDFDRDSDDKEDDENEFSGPNPDDDENLEDAEETVAYYEDELNHHQEKLQSAQNVLDDALRDPENAKDDIRRAKELLAKSTRGIEFNINKLKDANEKVKSFGGGEREESIKVINGKKYKAIKESKQHIFKKTYKKIGGK